MGRWEPGASGRLRAAALELYDERGFDQTTVADIAERAGVTSRTFFRHFTDKREVLFAGSEQLQEAMVEALTAAPPGVTPMAAVASAVHAAADRLGGDRDHSRRRQRVLGANAELRERELSKFDTLAAALAAGLCERGVAAPDAQLAAAAGMVVFRVGWDRWIAEPVERELTAVMAELLGQLHAITATA